MLALVLNALDLNLDGAVLSDEARRTHAEVVVDFGQTGCAILAWTQSRAQINRLITFFAREAGIAVGTLVVSIAEWNTQAIVVAGVGSELAYIKQQFALVATVAFLTVASVASRGVYTAVSVLKDTLA